MSGDNREHNNLQKVSGKNKKDECHDLTPEALDELYSRVDKKDVPPLLLNGVVGKENIDW